VAIDETPCVISFTRDISKLKEAERKRIESESSFRKIIESSPDAIAIIEFASGRVIEANDAFQEATGLSKEELLKATVRELGIWKSDEGLKESLTNLKKFGVIRSQPIDIKHRSGLRSPYLFSAVLADIGEKQCVVAIGQDVTDIREAEKALVAAREAALDGAKAKSEFLSNMSHEIRTPMNAILGMAEVLARTQLSEEQRRYVDLMRVNGDALLDLINDILDLAKIESGRLNMESADLDLEELIEKVGESMAVRAHEKGLEIAMYAAPDVPPNLIGDPLRLRQILFNLLGNAIKFTDQGEIMLTVERENLEDSTRAVNGHDPAVCLRFSVTDTGVGIPPGKLESIFSSFQQADSSTTRKYGGTGLGLAIVKRLVELHGGKISVRSEPGQGSCFSFTAMFRVGPADARKAVEMVSLNNIRVLVADDTALNRKVIRKNLEQTGAVVSEAATSEDTLAELKRAREAGQPYQLVLLDYLMTDSDEIVAASNPRQQSTQTQAKTWIVGMLTSEDLTARLARLEMMGIDAYLVKPVRRADLMKAVGRAMGMREKGDGVDQPVDMAENTLPPLHLLLADDSPVNRLLIKAYFNGTPVKLEEAENGQVAHDKFKAGKFDLVLMDIRMPVMDGYAATRAIRDWEHTNHLARTPIIALTASALEEEVRRCLEAGCDRHLSKPVKRGTLLETIERSIS